MEIQREQLHALSRFAGKQDVRPYLNGICIETGPKGTFAIATDGHRLGAIQLNADNQGDTVHSIIVPVEDLNRVPKKLPRGHADAPLKLTPDGRGGLALEDFAAGLTLHIALLDGKYPDWRQALPTKHNGQAGQFNPAYIKDFDLAANDLGANAVPRIVILHNGEAAAAVLVHNHPEFLGVLMPVRCKSVPVCDWWEVNETEAAE